MTTLQRPKDQSSWALANIDAKCRMLLYARLWQLCAKEVSVTTTLMHMCDLTGPTASPPNAHGLPTTLPYTCQYAMDMAYAAPPGPHKTMQKFKHCLCRMLLTMVNTSNVTSEMRGIHKNPELSWPRVWTNLHAAGLSNSINSTWYAAIHDTVSTNEQLAAIHLTTTMSCSQCGTTDTLIHRITKCEEGPVIRNWMRARLAALLRVHPKHVSEEWTLHPSFHYWPPQKQAVIVWISWST